MQIRFKRDTIFRKGFFTPESFAHPAKMDAQLLIWLVEKYTKEGDTILDPMFGSGTLMLACTLGRNVIGVELEQKFIDMAKANWEIVKMKPQLGSPMGWCEIRQGDARDLEGVLADTIITSPPYLDLIDYIQEDLISINFLFKKSKIDLIRAKSIGNRFKNDSLTEKLYWTRINLLLKEVVRILKPNHHFILIINNYKNMKNLYERFILTNNFSIERILKREVVNIKKRNNSEFVYFLKTNI
ncbi:hypothetical protein LCGC14_0888830 [marine sediment metagenome]|uniref:site-specific DNA-methyltransferase (cytosine-N(4)-specific) n=1 Tax=marine sediment metagenome TaxID=412755 RepID=A0A0F9NZW5_9ZZZZ